MGKQQSQPRKRQKKDNGTNKTEKKWKKEPRAK